MKNKTEIDWKNLALHALFDLQILGVNIELITTDETVLKELEVYSRNQTAYS